jgi:hypothetical protein
MHRLPAMDFYGDLAQAKPVSHLLIQKALGDQCHDLALAHRQLREAFAQVCAARRRPTAIVIAGDH